MTGVVVGLIIGFLIAVLAETWRERRRGMAAARAVYLEMHANLIAIERMRRAGFWIGAPDGPRRAVYESNAGALLLVLPAGAVNGVIYAYAEFDKIGWMVRAQEPIVLSDRDGVEEEFEALVAQLRESSEDSLERAAEIVRDAMMAVSTRATTWWQRVLLRRMVKSITREQAEAGDPADDLGIDRAMVEHLRQARSEHEGGSDS